MKKFSLLVSFMMAAMVAFAGTPTAPTVPTLGEWSLGILMISLLIIGVVAVRHYITKSVASKTLPQEEEVK